jgi:hypothetical protein
MAKFIFAYKFLSQTTSYLFEVKYTNVPDDAPKEQKLGIYLLLDGNFSKLKFISMSGEFREFEGSTLDTKSMIFTMGSDKYEIEECNEEEKEKLLQYI